MTSTKMIVWICSGLVLVAGCAGRRAGAPAQFTVQPLHPGERGAALDAAEAALVGRGYTIGARDMEGGVIVTEPVNMDVTSFEDRGRSLSSSSRTRRIAEVRVTGASPDLKVLAKVNIQEQATRGYRMMAGDRAVNDSPGTQTAIDRDAATSVEQNTVWKTVRRDRSAERELLQDIATRIHGSKPSTP